jgi:hypothetical protein
VASSLQQVGGPAIAPPGANRQQATVPFRRATTGRTQQLQSSAYTNVATPLNSFDVTIEGSGYMYGIDLDTQVTCAANAAAVAYFEDAPWSTFTAIVLRDVNGELVNLPGFSLRLANSYSKMAPNFAWNNYVAPPVAATNVITPDISVAQLSAAVGPGIGGSYRFHLEVPVALNRRSLWGLLGNQDRAQKYSLRTDLGSAAAAAAGPIYTTAPTTQGTGLIVRTYENYAVPGPTDANGNKQQQTPDKMGIVNFWTQSVNPSQPTASATINHYLPRLGNTIRNLILVYRSGAVATGRVNAEALLPTRIQFNLGDTPIFVETPAYRRNLMEQRFGAPGFQGVFAYDFITDFENQAGSELGDDYLWTSGLVNAQFQMAYPAGVATASLTVITGDSLVPPNVDIYA